MSLTDPKSGCFHKGEKEKCFAYSHHIFTDRKGYKQYKSNPEKCKNCPLRNQYTRSKNNQKVITRHIWEPYKEQTNENRYTELWKDNYPLRKETVERTFGDCKEQMGLRFTRVRGLLKNVQNSTMIFAYHNLKKMSLWRWKYRENIQPIRHVLSKILNFFKQKAVCCFKHTTLSTI